MLFRFFVLLFIGMLAFLFRSATVSAAPTQTVMNLSQPVNFSAIIFGACGSLACQKFVMPPLTNCNSDTCNCTDTMADQLGKCLQCGFDNIPGLSLNATQAYMNNFTSGCQAKGTPVKNETLVVNGAASELRGVKGAMSLAAVGVSMGVVLLHV